MSVCLSHIMLLCQNGAYVSSNSFATCLMHHFAPKSDLFNGLQMILFWQHEGVVGRTAGDPSRDWT